MMDGIPGSLTNTGIAQMHSCHPATSASGHPRVLPLSAHAETTPKPLDDSFLKHAMPNPHLKNSINMLDKGKVPSLNHVLLVVFAAIECDLFGCMRWP
jgi:hypothetical protein